MQFHWKMDNLSQSRTHILLADVVKGVHAKLRKDFKTNGDLNETWAHHKQDKELLGAYAGAMHALATDHWTKNPETRIDWCRNTCQEYFVLGGLKKVLDKEERRRKIENRKHPQTGEAAVSSETGCLDFLGDTTDITSELTEELPSSSQSTINSEQLQFSLSQSTHRSDEESNDRPSGVLKSHSGNSLALYDQDNDTTHFMTLKNVSTDSTLNAVTEGDSHLDGFDQQNRNNSSELDTLTHTLDDVSRDNTIHDNTIPITLNPPSAPDLLPASYGSDNVFKIPKPSDGKHHSSSNGSLKELVSGPGSGQDIVSLAVDCGSIPESNSPNLSSGEFNSRMEKYCNSKYNTIEVPFKGKLRLLDVGSCYNPFLTFEEFQAIGIDISPAVDSVYHCDFLHLETSDPLQLASDSINTYLHNLRSPIERLPRNIFHVVVFSLLLEYFPSPYQRWLCCQKAQQLLMINGLLLVITPDSHHQNKNAPMMKSWRTAIESMGFKRWRYVKQEHLHCLAFRKVFKDDSNHLVTDIHITPEMLFIPQDKHDYRHMNEPLFGSGPRSFEEMRFLRDQFEELPESVEEEMMDI